MTRLYNDPSHFADEAIDGFVAANRESVGRVAGGVLRAVGSPVGQVAVVIGGGSGHYPAFAGLVGPGMAAGAALGNVFASPSTNQIVSVAKAAQRGGGVLLTYGNYAGDVLNFSFAQDRLREEGVACESVPVTDDISSASVVERHKRRGIAGDLAVFKIAGAAAAEGWSLADVAGAARRANDRTRTLGVAFTGCTLPGAEAPLFTVPEGRMAVGLGIHGEPGLDEADVPTANGLAGLLVQRLLQELPSEVASAEGQRVVVILNGLGSVKYDELFVVYREADRLLRGSGITVVDCEVGEICTSFDMAGVSLTLVWLDEELERLWLEPAETPAFRRGAVAIIGDRDAGASTARPVETLAPPASEASRQSAARAVEIFAAIRDTIDRHADNLGLIDAVAGDGDHGIGMQRGAAAAADAALDAYAQGAGVGSLFVAAGEAWADRAGGTSGALWGLGLRRIGRVLGDQDPPTAENIAAAIHAARLAVIETGGAQVGDKTLVDVLVPFDDTLSNEISRTGDLAAAWDRAAREAEHAAQATKNLLPRTGRARPHAEKSLGTPDAGAVSLSLVVAAVSTLWRSHIAAT
jgi:D-erythrulose 4-kinase